MAAGQLLWRCRRGTKELDVLLERYVHQSYAQATPAERSAFGRLLDLPDPQLTDFFFGYATPDDPGMAALVVRIASWGQGLRPSSYAPPIP